ncbi:MAG TPA: protein translocase subunit SecF [Caulobacteraceae bacterium]|nr:protein translocase subunit SecF [Caulobacteraceae bacterium]
MKFWPLIRLLPKETHFRFVSFAPYAAVVSALAVIASITSFALLGLNFGTDFRGGTQIAIQTPGPAALGQLRAALGQMGAKDPQVSSFGAANAAVLRFEPAPGVNPANAVAAVEAQIQKEFPGTKVTDEEVFGAKVSGELFRGGLLALGSAIGLMLLYIWFRFQLQFGLGAVIALAHDIILTMGALSILHIEFSMPSIAALLTVIGYSMNEKVISFDRLRENLKKHRSMALADIINLSENERLSRTLITGSTALLALSGMLFLGGPTIFPVVFAMVFGIVVGTYSSIYVALPVILLWGVNRSEEEAQPIRPMGARLNP